MKKYDIFTTIKSIKDKRVIEQTVIITITAPSKKEAYDIIKNRCFEVVNIDNIKEA